MSVLAKVMGVIFDSSGYGYVTDFDFTLFFSGTMVFGSLILFALPLSSADWSGRWIYRYPHAFVIWIVPIMVPGLMVLAMISPTDLLSHSFDMLVFLLWVALPGAIVAGALIPWLTASRIPTWMVSAAPVATIVLLMVLAWPIMLNLAPDVVAAHGTFEARRRATMIILDRVEVGDSATELAQRYPSVFEGNGWMGSSSRWHANGETMGWDVTIDPVTQKVSHVARSWHDGEVLTEY